MIILLSVHKILDVCRQKYFDYVLGPKSLQRTTFEPSRKKICWPSLGGPSYVRIVCCVKYATD